MLHSLMHLVLDCCGILKPKPYITLYTPCLSPVHLTHERDPTISPGVCEVILWDLPHGKRKCIALQIQSGILPRNNVESRQVRICRVWGLEIAQEIGNGYIFRNTLRNYCFSACYLEVRISLGFSTLYALGSLGMAWGFLNIGALHDGYEDHDEIPWGP